MTLTQAGRSLAFGIVFGAGCFIANASAQKLPDQVRVLVPFTPGGAADTGVRIVSQWINQNGGPQWWSRTGLVAQAPSL